MKKSLKEKMDAASLEELMPDFDKEAQWQQLSLAMHKKKRLTAWTWKSAAAVLLLFTTGLIAFMLSQNSKTGMPETALTQSSSAHNWIAEVAPAIPVPSASGTAAKPPASDKPIPTEVPAASRNTTKNTMQKPVVAGLAGNSGYHRTREFVCNGTPCPLEICIIQTISCKNGKPAAISTCNMLLPDQARQLHYKAPEAAGNQCKVTIDEIRIKRVTTGETIVLNAHSKPSTAEELFNCLTGNEKCGMLAGIFEADCNNQQRKHSLKIDNNSGNLIME